MRLLIVEDNPSLVGNLFDYFEPRGHVLDAAPDGVTGLHLALTQAYDAMVLDWMLPRMSGPELLRALRDSERCELPVMLLTAKDQLDDKLLGFGAGADDYLSKPFALPELEARLQALLARSRGRRPRELLQVADLRYDLRTLEVERGGRALHLYPAGRRLLQALMQASPAALSRDQLERALWGDEPPSGDPLRSHIYDLRQAIDAPFPRKLLHTLPRIGYRLAEAEPDAAP